MSEEKKSAREKVTGGIKSGIGVLSALKDALEETIQEAKDRGDLSADRAKEVVKDALRQAQEAAEEAKDKLDFVNAKEFGDAVQDLRERVSALEVHIFGESKDSPVEAGEAPGASGDDEAEGEGEAEASAEGSSEQAGKDGSAG